MDANYLRLNLLIAILLMLLIPFACGSDAPAFPLWDNHESIAEYAKKVNLPPTQTLDLGGGVKLELVLIPAGKFIMGTPEPTLVNVARFQNQILNGLALLAVSAVSLLVMLRYVVVQALRNKRRPQLSLSRLLMITVAAGGCVLSGIHWWHSVKALELARVEFETEAARYNSADPAEIPAHSVTLTKPFYMGKYDVTQEQYQQVIGANPSFSKGKGIPVDMVSWYDAQAFCKKLTEQTKHTLRLPTEAEWEYACRAGTTTMYYSGDAEADLARVAWFTANSIRKMHPVGQKESNKFGLYDMHGNVYQWCQDWYTIDYYGISESENPSGPELGTCRLLRGGLWRGKPIYCRSAYRCKATPDGRGHGVGFRVVMVPTP